MKKIDVSGLRLGDILLTTTTQPVSKAIRLGTKSDISHAMVYVAAYSVIDSTLEGVHARNTQRMFYADDCAVHALRLKEPLSVDRLEPVIDYLRARTGTPYDRKEAIRSIGRPRGKGSSKQFCSRLVARAFAEAGVMLVENPDFCTPAQLKASPLLQLLSNPAVDVSEVEQKAFGEDGTGHMREIINSFLDSARELFPEINSIEDALQRVLQNPEIDGFICAALKRSGYLDFWKFDLAEFPWRYSIVAMVSYVRDNNCAASVARYCEEAIEHYEMGTFQHWVRNEAVARDIARRTGLRTYGAMEHLYAQLNSSTTQRIDTARVWLASLGV